MQLFSQSGFQSKRTHSETHWRETAQVQPAQFCYNTLKPSEATQKKPFWRKAWRETTQMQPVRLHYTWRDTKGPTLGRSLTDAQCASIPSLQLVTWKSTWWGCIQEKSHLSATRAITFALCMVSCRATWSHTLCRSPLSATDAAKLTSIRGILQHIWEFTWSDSQHLHKTRLSSHSIPEFTRPRLALWFLSIKF